MGKYSGILLCTDFDYTVAIKTVVSQENADAIRYFCDNGGIFSIISGRDVPFMKTYEEYLSLRSYVGCVNGTVLCHLPTGKISEHAREFVYPNPMQIEAEEYSYR